LKVALNLGLEQLDTCRQRLSQGLQQLQIALPEGGEGQLMAYLQLLHQWNQAYNLTAVRDPLEMVSRHLLDSLAILPYIRGPRLLDMGTGAGLPGVPLAIARPDLRFSLLDSNGKKIRFIRQVQLQLQLGNIHPIQQRAEALGGQFDQITARAFASLDQLMQLASPLLVVGGELLALKGARESIGEETRGLDSNVSSHSLNQSLNIVPLNIPFLPDQQRHLLIYRRSQP
jgi:16S rRNA (guanine527-N7)-methyltransferase